MYNHDVYLSFMFERYFSKYIAIILDLFHSYLSLHNDLHLLDICDFTHTVNDTNCIYVVFILTFYRIFIHSCYNNTIFITI